jgi:hypothetical protein
MQLVLLYSLLTTISAIALPGGVVSAILDEIEHGGFASASEAFVEDTFKSQMMKGLIQDHIELTSEPKSVIQRNLKSDKEIWDQTFNEYIAQLPPRIKGLLEGKDDKVSRSVKNADGKPEKAMKLANQQKD